MKDPTLPDIISEIYEKLDNVEISDTEFGDPDNETVTIPNITSISAIVSYYASPITHDPQARITWSWATPEMYDEDGNVIDPNDPEIADDMNIDPVVDYMFGTAFNSTNPILYASTKGSNEIVTDGHILGSNITGTVYAVLRSGIIGPSISFEATVSKDTTAPEAPSNPSLTSSASVVTVSYNGKDKNNQEQANDYWYTEILAGVSSPPTDKVGEFRGPGSYSFGADPSLPIYVQLFSYDRSGNRSDGCDIVLTDVKSILDDTGLVEALANKAVIYSQSDDPAIANDVHDGDWWFVTDPINTSVIITIKNRISGAWVTDTIHAAQVLAAQSIVAGQLSADSVIADNISAGEIYAKLTLTNELKADAITTGILKAVVTVSGMLRTAENGRRVVIDDTGITLWGLAADGITEIPVIVISTTGESSFGGHILASSITVFGKMQLNDVANVGPGAMIILEDRIGATSTTPTVTVVYDTVQLAPVPLKFFAKTGSDGYFALSYIKTPAEPGQPAPIGAYQVGGFYVSYRLIEYDANMVEINNHSMEGYGGGSSHAGATYLNGAIYVLSKYNTNGSTATNCKIVKYVFNESSWEISNVYDGTSALGKAGVDIINNGIKLYVLGVVTTKRKFHAYSESGVYGGATFEKTVAQSASFKLYQISDFGSGDGVQKLAYYYNQLGTEQDKSPMHFELITNGVEQKPMSFNLRELPADCKFFYWDSSNGYYSIDESGVKTYYNGMEFVGDLVTKTYDFRYASFDSNPDGGTHESIASPKVAIAIPRKAKVQISVPGWLPDTSTVDSVNALRYYGGLASSQVYELGHNSIGALTTGVIPTSGVIPTPIEFPKGAPAKLQNTDQSLIISGDGSVLLDGFQVKGYPITWVGGLNGLDTSSLTANNFRSIKPSTAIESTGEWVPEWLGDTLVMPINAWVLIVWQCTFGNVSSGNRLMAISKNYPTDTLNSSGFSGTGRLVFDKFAATSDEVTGTLTWLGSVNAGDKIMFIAKTSTATAVVGDTNQTRASISIIRAL